MKTKNPFFREWTSNYGAVPFGEIKFEHFSEAFEEGMKLLSEEFKAIIENKETPTYENTIQAFQYSGMFLKRVSSVFYNLSYSDTTKEIEEYKKEISPKLTELRSGFMQNEDFYERFKAVYDKRDELNLGVEEKMLLKDLRRGFENNGISLSKDERVEFMQLKKENSKLSSIFAENLRKEVEAYELLVQDIDVLKGVPENLIEAAKEKAEEKGKRGWLFGLDYPSKHAIYTYVSDRSLREKFYRDDMAHGSNGGEFDNREILVKISNNRLKMAKMLGYENYSEWAFEETLMGSLAETQSFIQEILDCAYPIAKEDVAAVESFAKEFECDSSFVLNKWDYSYYREKLKKKDYGFDEEETKPYFKLESVIDGVFALVKKLYNLEFRKSKIEGYNKDVKVFEVYLEGKIKGVLHCDFHPRDSKGPGAWMNDIVDSYYNLEGKRIIPHIVIVMNFSPSTKTTPSLLTFSEVQTFLHEFGHALHGLLTDVKNPSLAGTNVERAFVELPSQVMEHFAYEKEFFLDTFAKHYITGEPLPEALLKKMIRAKNFQKGYLFTRQLSFSLLDLSWHSRTEEFKGDVLEHESKVMEQVKLFPDFPKGIKGGLSPQFSHIFTGGYSSLYISYMKSDTYVAETEEVLRKNNYSKKIVNKFLTEILEKGGSEEARDLFENFAGKQPDVKTLMKRDGLIK